MRSRIYASVMWWDYVQQVAKGAKQAEIAEKAGVNQVTVSRWKKGADSARPENVAAFARAYDRPVLEAFVAAGFLTAEEANVRPDTVQALSDLDDDALIGEVARRLKVRVMMSTGSGKTMTAAMLAAEPRPREVVEQDLRIARMNRVELDELPPDLAETERLKADADQQIADLEYELGRSTESNRRARLRG